MLRIGTRLFDIVIAHGNNVILRGSEEGVSQIQQDLWGIDKRELTADAQQMVETWEEVSYHD